MMFDKAKVERDEHIKQTTEWSQVPELLNTKNLVLVPFCGDKACEEAVKKDSESKNPRTFVFPLLLTLCLAVLLDHFHSVLLVLEGFIPQCIASPF